jgi:hypothetical protein
MRVSIRDNLSLRRVALAERTPSPCAPVQAAAGRDLDATFFHSHRNAQMSVRWVYLHMIEEYARHNGHADLLRERIDGATGL